MFRSCVHIGRIETKRMYDSSDSFHRKIFDFLPDLELQFANHRVDKYNFPTSKICFAYHTRAVLVNSKSIHCLSLNQAFCCNSLSHQVPCTAVLMCVRISEALFCFRHQI